MSIFRVNCSTEVFPILPGDPALPLPSWPTAVAVMEAECRRDIDLNHQQKWVNFPVEADDEYAMVGNVDNLYLLADISSHETGGRKITFSATAPVYWIKISDVHIIARLVLADTQPFTRTRNIPDVYGIGVPVTAHVYVVIRAEQTG